VLAGRQVSIGLIASARQPIGINRVISAVRLADLTRVYGVCARLLLGSGLRL
jgi:uncharacterized membrane protein